MAVELYQCSDGPPDAPMLVLAGSLGCPVEMWRPQVAALAERYRVVRIDHRGHGRSPVPAGPYRMSDLGSDVLALLARLGAERVSWCGLSLGGMVGLWLATEAAERIDRLVLCCTSARFPDPMPWRDRAAAVRDGGTAAIAASVVGRWFTRAYAAAHPEQVQAARRWITETPDEGYIACCQAIEVWDHVAVLPSISAPTLVIAGAHDPAAPVDPHARTLAERIPGARLAVLDAAHLATIERADEVNELIVRYLG